MRKSCDVVLVGTGLAAVVGAHQFLQAGKSVVLLNPDRGFFLENSELPLDPLWLRTDAKVSSKRLRRSLPDHVLRELREVYPGLIEYRNISQEIGESKETEFKDSEAPFVRSRSRMWLRSTPSLAAEDEELWHRIFVESADAGLKPLELDSLSAVIKVAGIEKKSLAQRQQELSRFEGILIPKVCDVDVGRYRNGFLEFLHQKVGPDEIIEDVSDITFQSREVRFYANGEFHRLDVREGVVVYWTPRLSGWIRKTLAPLSTKEALREYEPDAIRTWEEWMLVSRTPVSVDTVSAFGDLFVWGGDEGDLQGSQTGQNTIKILRAGELLEESSYNHPQSGMTWAGQKSFEELSRFCFDLIGWEKFTIRSFESRSIFEWRGGKGAPDFKKFWNVSANGLSTFVIHGCDGPVSEVVHRAQQSSKIFSGEPI